MEKACSVSTSSTRVSLSEGALAIGRRNSRIRPGPIITKVPWLRVWFLRKGSVRRLVMLGERCKRRPDTTHSTRCATISTHLFRTECLA